MSSKGQIIGAVAGFVLGAITGGFSSAISLMALGGRVGLWLDPAVPEPDDLGDLGMNSYVRDAPVPLVFGTNKVYGGCIWTGENSAFTSNDGSSKNPEYITLATCEFAIAFATGPITKYRKFIINEDVVATFTENTHIVAPVSSYTEAGGFTTFYFPPQDTEDHYFAGGCAYTVEWVPYNTYEGIKYYLGEVPRLIADSTTTSLAVYGYCLLTNPQTSEVYDPVGGPVHMYTSGIVTANDEDNHLDLYFAAYLGTRYQSQCPIITSSDPENALPFVNTAYVCVTGTIGTVNTLPTFAAELTGLVTDPSQYDCNPVILVYWFLTNAMDGCGEYPDDFDGNPRVPGSGSWYTEAAYCAQLVYYNLTISTRYSAYRYREDEVALIVTTTNHLLEIGDSVTITGMGGSGYNGTKTVTGVPSSLSFEFDSSFDDEGWTYDPNGYITGPDRTSEGNEARFMYSNVFTDFIKGYDIITDILQTCGGMVYKVQDKWCINIAKGSEQPIFYFSDFHREHFEVDNTSTTTRIYADFSDYPDIYWNGDLGWITVIVIIEEEEVELSYSFIVINQTATYIDLAEELPTAPEIGDAFFITKDNITSGSFSYMQRSDAETINVSRVEYLNRDDEYRNDVVEVVDNSKGEYYDGTFYADTTKIQTISMTGIKRKSQAMRMAQLLLDLSCFAKYSCQFDTDIVGYMIHMGAIVGISHSATGWIRKYFRVIKLEENDDLTVKLNFNEYVPSVYNDYTPPYVPTVPSGIGNRYEPPANIPAARVYAYDGRIFLAIERPTGDAYWSGAQVYIQRGEIGEFEYYRRINTTTANVKLSAGVTAVQDYIPFDDSTLYSSFPASGTFFLEEEQIHYTSIDSVNNQFEGCTRGYNSTTAAIHADTEYCTYFDINVMPYYTYTAEEIGIPLTFKFVSINFNSVMADATYAPTDTITISS